MLTSIVVDSGQVVDRLILAGSCPLGADAGGPQAMLDRRRLRTLSLPIESGPLTT